jgi:hypothetical protein
VAKGGLYARLAELQFGLWRLGFRGLNWHLAGVFIA